jgi:hypothetical protein
MTAAPLSLSETRHLPRVAYEDLLRSLTLRARPRWIGSRGPRQDVRVSQLARRAEVIGAHLVGHALGTTTREYDGDGRQGAVDFMLEWPDGRRGALEVTLITEPGTAPWQGLAAKEAWRWPAPSSWHFRLAESHMSYRRTRTVVLRAVARCDEWDVDTPWELPDHVLSREPDIAALHEVGDLRRTGFSPGVVILPAMRSEFVEATSPDFVFVLERWLELPHMPAHVEKTRSAQEVEERHLFLVPVDEVLPARFFANDFPAPDRAPTGFEGLDGVWVWSNFWHQVLVWRGGTWSWVDFPPND